MQLMITLKQSDADSLGGEILESLGMSRHKADPKLFSKNLGIMEMANKFTDMASSDDDADDDKVSGAARAYRRRMRRRLHPTDFLLYEDNSLYALPFIEPLTDRGIRPMRVQLITDSTAGLTPIGASTTAASVDNKQKARQFMAIHQDEYSTATELAEATALEHDLYEDDVDFTIPEWVFEFALEFKDPDDGDDEVTASADGVVCQECGEPVEEDESPGVMLHVDREIDLDHVAIPDLSDEDEEPGDALPASATSASSAPSPEEIYKKYLAPDATDKKGKKYVFGSDPEPDHFKLAESVLGDLGHSADADDELETAVHEACEEAEAMWLMAEQSDDT